MNFRLRCMSASSDAGLSVSKLCPSLEAYVGQRVDHCFEVDRTRPQIVRIVLQVNFADACPAQPANFLHYVEASFAGVADIVVSENGGGFGPLHDTNVVAGGDRVLEPEDYAGPLGCGGNLLKSVAHFVHLLHIGERAFAEEGKQNDSHIHGLRDRNGVGHPALPERIRLEVIMVQDFEAKRLDRKIHALGLVQESSLQGRIGKGKLVSSMADADLYSIEAQLLGKADSFNLAFLLQVPVRNPYLEFSTRPSLRMRGPSLRATDTPRPAPMKSRRVSFAIVLILLTVFGTMLRTDGRSAEYQVALRPVIAYVAAGH